MSTRAGSSSVDGSFEQRENETIPASETTAGSGVSEQPSDLNPRFGSEQLSSPMPREASFVIIDQCDGVKRWHARSTAEFPLIFPDLEPKERLRKCLYIFGVYYTTLTAEQQLLAKLKTWSLVSDEVENLEGFTLAVPRDVPANDEQQRYGKMTIRVDLGMEEICESPKDGTPVARAYQPTPPYGDGLKGNASILRGYVVRAGAFVCWLIQDIS
jgi:hypothetical protein